jgi:hypothetical protein
VIVNGKRVTTIDVHAHCLFRDAIALMGEDAKGVEPPVKGAPEHYIPASDKSAVEERLAAMDAMGVDVEVLSINPFWYRKDRDTAAAIVKLNNERLAELSAAYPKRLKAFASLSLQAPDLAVKQLEDAMMKQGLRGAGHWRECGRRRLLRSQVPSGLGQGRGTRRRIVHPPAVTTRTGEALQGQRVAVEHNRQPARHDHRAAASDLRGTLDKFPGLKIIARTAAAISVPTLPFRPCVLRVAGQLQSGHRPQEEADGVSEPHLLRCARIHGGSAQTSGGASGREPGGDRDRSSDSLGGSSGRSRDGDDDALDDAARAILGGNAARLLKIDDVS